MLHLPSLIFNNPYALKRRIIDVRNIIRSYFKGFKIRCIDIAYH